MPERESHGKTKAPLAVAGAGLGAAAVIETAGYGIYRLAKLEKKSEPATRTAR